MRSLRPELNGSTDHRQRSRAIELRPTPPFTPSRGDPAVRSLDPGEVDPETAIAISRFSSTRNPGAPAVSEQINPLTPPEVGLAVQREFKPRTPGTLR